MPSIDREPASIDELLAEARRSLTRLTPRQAAESMRRGALLIDTRPIDQRQRDGTIPGAIVVDRNVLEWRLDPTSPDRIPEITHCGQAVIAICNQGYSSSLAAATLKQLGLRQATDVIGGFEAWAAAGLPVVSWAPNAVTDRRPDPGDGHDGPPLLRQERYE